MPLIPQKTCQLIIDSSNDYIAALKGNQPNLLKDVKTNFKPKSTYEQINKGMVELKSVAPAFAET
jgi:hypothetical protein